MPFADDVDVYDFRMHIRCQTRLAAICEQGRCPANAHLAGIFDRKVGPRRANNTTASFVWRSAGALQRPCCPSEPHDSTKARFGADAEGPYGLQRCRHEGTRETDSSRLRRAAPPFLHLTLAEGS